MASTATRGRNQQKCAGENEMYWTTEGGSARLNDLSRVRVLSNQHLSRRFDPSSGFQIMVVFTLEPKKAKKYFKTSKF